ncbi:hypothetical protein FHS57_003832 [Runella defluvii]|uniref:Uncharacterized protein n=1 Tax=Runella defluvii TaxID=370973 RepID=A0A7W6ERW1_9BACT|nr:hypothetical protein [Runella defluvii]MBB3839821.1 hypothetical protein [Runella defluvii]
MSSLVASRGFENPHPQLESILPDGTCGHSFCKRMFNRALGFSGCALGFSNPNAGVAHNPDCLRLLPRGDLRIPAHS